MKLDKDYTNTPYSFLVNDTTVLSKHSLRFRKKLLQKSVITIKTMLNMN